MKSSVALIGFMGVGKTAVGLVLAKKLGKKFVELDALIAQKAGKSIPEIFAQEGEIAFRELEIEAVKDIAGKDNLVIACGGGVVLNKINIDRLKQSSVIVLLTASPGVILRRVSRDGADRPLLKGAKKAADIQSLLRYRKPFYERAADFKIDTSKLDVNAVADEIIKKLRDDESFDK